jgi:hypothetical protein
MRFDRAGHDARGLELREHLLHQRIAVDQRLGLAQSTLALGGVASCPARSNPIRSP